ncbi:MAG: hypothetical protein SGJ09_17730 [Phycisphaerae bacterium]|nr:hypothetical protein [Phycisphaerae bacterium]
MSLLQISARPPRSEIETTRRELRQAIYLDANRELAILNESLLIPGQPWEMSAMTLSESIDDLQTAARGMMARELDAPAMMRSRSSDRGRVEDVDEEAKNIAVGMRITMMASVVFRRLAVPQPKGGFFSTVDA